ISKKGLINDRRRETSSTSVWARSRLFQKFFSAIGASSAVNFSWSLGRSKKPPQLAHARFQIFGVNGGFGRHRGNYSKRKNAQRGVVGGWISASTTCAARNRDQRLALSLRLSACAAADSIRKMVSPSFIKSSRSRTIVSK